MSLLSKGLPLPPALNGVAESALPSAQTPPEGLVQVKTFLAPWALGKSLRMRSAAPPLSTRSPSGKSEAWPTSVAAKVGPRNAHMLDAVVQKLSALFEMKPVAAFSAGLPLASARKTELVAVFRPSLYIFRFPNQRGAFCASGRNTPM